MEYFPVKNVLPQHSKHEATLIFTTHPPIHASERLTMTPYTGRAGSMPKGGVRVKQPEGRDQRWVCVSQLMRVSTDRLHHQHPTLTSGRRQRP